MYPLQVEVNVESVKKLTKTFKTAYAQIVKEITTATDWGVANRKAILSQIEQTLTDLGVNVQEFLETELPEYYKVGADEAVEQLENVGAKIGVKEGFNRLHNEAIAALVDDASRSFGESMTGVARSAQLLLGKISRETLTQQIAEGVIGGKARAEVGKVIKATLQEQGLDALIDKAGHSWTLDRYADMLFRTKVVEARNRGLINRMVENGYDLVQVSSHPGSCEMCAPWQGQILSARGVTPGYPTVAQAESEGLFHPNCRHAINVLIPSLAKQTSAYGTGTGEYGLPGVGLLPAYERLAQRKLIGQATRYSTIFDNKLDKISKEVNTDYLLGPVKGVPRTAEKILYDYNGDIYGMKDVNRSVFFINDPNDKQAFDDLLKAVEKEYGPISTSDIKIQLDISGSYASNKISVPTPYGAKAEIQVTTREMWKAKTTLGGNDMYGEWRANNISAERKAKLLSDMEKLYNEANKLTALRLAQ